MPAPQLPFFARTLFCAGCTLEAGARARSWLVFCPPGRSAPERGCVGTAEAGGRLSPRGGLQWWRPAQSPGGPAPVLPSPAHGDLPGSTLSRVGGPQARLQWGRSPVACLGLSTPPCTPVLRVPRFASPGARSLERRAAPAGHPTPSPRPSVQFGVLQEDPPPRAAFFTVGRCPEPRDAGPRDSSSSHCKA